MKVIPLILLLTACGSTNTIKVKGGTTHTVSGEVKTIFTVDFAICNDFKDQQKLDCITALADLIAGLNKDKK